MGRKNGEEEGLTPTTVGTAVLVVVVAVVIVLVVVVVVDVTSFAIK